ncbi:DUF5327 family protein [Exiguobacterium flavidum]|uniref:DUF5327 family protein n=1 Tax=Exiguobacterium flavidum TaxID=2184695 RepID=UPI000DF820E5|nr:DUF5327 family protein [Exiguobacterium flavidum]
MISEQQVIEKMRQAMERIGQTTGTVRTQEVAALKAYCELLLLSEEPAGTSAPQVVVPGAANPEPKVDPMMAKFLGLSTDEEEKPSSLLDF